MTYLMVLIKRLKENPIERNAIAACLYIREKYQHEPTELDTLKKFLIKKDMIHFLEVLDEDLLSLSKTYGVSCFKCGRKIMPKNDIIRICGTTCAKTFPSKLYDHNSKEITLKPFITVNPEVSA